MDRLHCSKLVGSTDFETQTFSVPVSLGTHELTWTLTPGTSRLDYGYGLFIHNITMRGLFSSLTKPVPCPAGTSSDEGQTSCTPCPANYSNLFILRLLSNPMYDTIENKLLSLLDHAPFATSTFIGKSVICGAFYIFSLYCLLTSRPGDSQCNPIPTCTGIKLEIIDSTVANFALNKGADWQALSTDCSKGTKQTVYVKVLIIKP